eukprot:643665-Amphidinium_carterae.1
MDTIKLCATMRTFDANPVNKFVRTMLGSYFEQQLLATYCAWDYRAVKQIKGLIENGLDLPAAEQRLVLSSAGTHEVECILISLELHFAGQSLRADIEWQCSCPSAQEVLTVLTMRTSPPLPRSEDAARSHCVTSASARDRLSRRAKGGGKLAQVASSDEA